MLGLQIALLGIFGLGTSLQSINENWVKPRMFFEGRYYLNNTMPRFRDRVTTAEDQINFYIRTQTHFIILKSLSINMGAQGSATQHGFGGGGGYPQTGGTVGGIWGMDILFTKGFQLEWEHHSAHCGDTLGRCGSYDYVGFKFMYGFHDLDRVPLLDRLIRWE